MYSNTITPNGITPSYLKSHESVKANSPLQGSKRSVVNKTIKRFMKLIVLFLLFIDVTLFYPTAPSNDQSVTIHNKNVSLEDTFSKKVKETAIKYNFSKENRKAGNITDVTTEDIEKQPIFHPSLALEKRITDFSAPKVPDISTDRSNYKKGYKDNYKSLSGLFLLWNIECVALLKNADSTAILIDRVKNRKGTIKYINHLAYIGILHPYTSIPQYLRSKFKNEGDPPGC